MRKTKHPERWLRAKHRMLGFSRARPNEFTFPTNPGERPPAGRRLSSMPRIYTSDVTCPPELAEELGRHGFELVAEEPPDPAPRGDLCLVPACTGITADLRHALNNPLTAVIGFAQLLERRTDLSPEAMDKVGKVREHAERIRTLIRRPEDFDA